MAHRQRETALPSSHLFQSRISGNTSGVPRVDDQRVLNVIFWVLRSGTPWRNLLERCGPYTTCYNRFRCWTKPGVRDRLMDAVPEHLLLNKKRS